MKNTLKFILASFCAFAFIGCEPAEPELDSNLNKDLTFTLELDEVDATSAKIKVSHNGTKEDTWFGFATTEANPLDAVEDLVAEVLANTSKVSLKKSTQTTYSVKELTPETEYTFVVLGLTAEGVVYGFPNSIEFKTTRDLTKLVEDKERWKLSYERIVYEGEPTADLKPGDDAEAITIECADDDLFYFEYVSEYYITDPETGDLLLEDYADYIANGMIPEYITAGYRPEQFTYVGGGALLLPRIESGKYYAFVIGMTAEGVHDGSYTTFAFEVLEEAATAEYEQWFGTYEVTDANDVSYVIDIQRYDNNFMYAVTGWECGEELDADANGDGYPDGMDFGTAFGDWVPAFPLYFNDGKLEFREYVLTNTSVYNEMNQEVPCFLGFYGYVLTSDGQLSITLTDQKSPLAIASTTDGAATATVAACEIPDDKNNMVEINSLSYAAIAQDYSDVFVWNQPAELPFTLTKVVEEAAPAVQALSCDHLVKSQPSRKIAAGKTFKAELSEKSDKTIKMYNRK